jgi:hypothetical protein
MSLKVSDGLLRAAYEYIRATDPTFWRKLPPVDEVSFKTIKAKTHYGDCDGETIRASSARHAHSVTLLATTAHEMAHMLDFVEGGDGSHGKRFQKFAKRICRVNGFDVRAF